jgi:hypothetical protein
MKIHPSLRFGLLALFLALPAQALVLDLTTAGASGTINGATFTQIPGFTAGTGLIDSFVRVQQNGGEDGFNASVRPVMTNVNTDPNFTRDIRLSALPIVNGAYQVLLDINQTAAEPFLSLDALRVFTRPSLLGALTTAAQLTDLTQAIGIQQRYTLDIIGGADNTVKLDYSLNPGSGRGDMILSLPTSLFSGSSPTDFVYIYSRFGDTFAANDGFEEWSVREATPVATPDQGSTLILLGLGLATCAFFRRLVVC